MKSETNNWKMMNLMEAVLNGNREGLNMISQNLGLSISIFNSLESSMALMFQRINQVKSVIVNNQMIIVKQGVINMNLLLKVQKEMKIGMNEFNKKVNIFVRKNLNSMQGIILTHLGEKIQIFGINVNNLRVENEKMLATGFGQLYDKLKGDMQDNNVAILKVLNENRTNNDWFGRMENNLNVIFGEIREERKKEKAYKKSFADKMFKQFILVQNRQELLTNLIQNENIEIRKIFSNDLNWISQKIRKWFDSMKEDNNQLNHYEVMMNEFDGTKRMILNIEADNKQIKDENANNMMVLYNVINENSAKIEKSIEKIEKARENISGFLQEQDEISMKRFVINNNQLKINYNLINTIKGRIAELGKELQVSIKESSELSRVETDRMIATYETLESKSDATLMSICQLKDETLEKLNAGEDTLSMNMRKMENTVMESLTWANEKIEIIWTDTKKCFIEDRWFDE
jgi:hypothetical protein